MSFPIVRKDLQLRSVNGMIIVMQASSDLVAPYKSRNSGNIVNVQAGKT